jgi:DNA-directed RNA polymerase specialized sigma subunit
MSQQDAAPGKKRGLTRPIEVVRAELLKDPDTKRIAKAVGMELEAYVELVLQYAQDKDKQPVLNVVEDEELKAKGFKVVSQEEAAQLLVAAAKGELGGPTQEFEKSEFQASKGGPKGPSLSGETRVNPDSDKKGK